MPLSTQYWMSEYNYLELFCLSSSVTDTKILILTFRFCHYRNKFQIFWREWEWGGGNPVARRLEPCIPKQSGKTLTVFNKDLVWL